MTDAADVPMPYPIDAVNDRAFEAGWSGEVFVCDIDRTYLATRFSSLRGLSRIPFEFAVDKQDIEGMAALLKEVRRGPERASRQTPLYFVSASPAQLRRVIDRKMLLDGIEHDGTVFKDWAGVLAGLRPGRLRDQLGFKLTALLHLVEVLPAGARLVLLGDDLETDALAFCVLADGLAGRLDARAIAGALRGAGVARGDARAVCRQLDEVRARRAGRPGVTRALIRLERHASAEAFIDCGPGLVACAGAFQSALALWNHGSISSEGACRVARDLARRGASPDDLDSRLCDWARRGATSAERLAALRAELAAAGVLAPGRDLPGVDPAWREAGARGPDEPWTPSRFWT